MGNEALTQFGRLTVSACRHRACGFGTASRRDRPATHGGKFGPPYWTWRDQGVASSRGCICGGTAPDSRGEAVTARPMQVTASGL